MRGAPKRIGDAHFLDRLTNLGGNQQPRADKLEGKHATRNQNGFAAE
jgi:hypothetical protein